MSSIAQPTGTLALWATRAWASARGDPTPFTTTSAEAGVASYAGEGRRTEAPIAAVSLEYRPGPGDRVHVSGGYDAVRPGAAAFAGALRVEREDEGRTLSLTLARTARQDSFRALAGAIVAGQRVGAASDDGLELRLGAASAEGRVELAARAGQVEGAGMPSTFFAGASARLERPVGRAGAWRLSAGAAAGATHHARDLSGADGNPAAPRLFSPLLFVTLSPRLVLAREAGASRLRLDAGPALQHASGAGAAVRAGGDLTASLSLPLGERLRLGAEVRGERVAAAYARLEAGATLTVAF